MSDRSAYKILYVDDHQDTLDVVKKLLGRRGYSVQTAPTLSSAIDSAGREYFDLLVVDVGLPDGDGLKLLAEVQTMYAVRDIVVSGYGRAEDVHKSLHAGYEVHLTKPVSFDILCNTVAQVLNSETPARQIKNAAHG